MLPFELIVEVLLRLPVKSLLRFRCVCKSWNALISGPEFAKKHLRTSAIMDPTHFFTRHHLILCPTYEPILRDYSLPSIFSCSGVTASATQLEFPPSAAVGSRSAFFRSCHGMLCIRNEQDCALMWNPCTGKFKTLPSLETPGVRGCPLIYSFGYDHFSDSYKVVALSWSVRHETDVKVHALGTDSWRAIQRFPANAPFHAGRFVSGMLNWLAKDIARPSWVIVSLDMGTETYQQLLPPDCLVDDVNFTLNLGVLHDSLCIVATCNQFSDVWVMKDYGNKESWTKLLVVPYFADYPQYAHHNDHDYSFPTALWISDEDDEVLLLLEWMLAVYNSNSGSFRTLGIPQLGHLIRAVVYAESLISPCF